MPYTEERIEDSEIKDYTETLKMMHNKVIDCYCEVVKTLLKESKCYETSALIVIFNLNVGIISDLLYRYLDFFSSGYQEIPSVDEFVDELSEILKKTLTYSIRKQMN